MWLNWHRSYLDMGALSLLQAGAALILQALQLPTSTAMVAKQVMQWKERTEADREKKGDQLIAVMYNLHDLKETTKGFPLTYTLFFFWRGRKKHRVELNITQENENLTHLCAFFVLYWTINEHFPVWYLWREHKSRLKVRGLKVSIRHIS